MRHIDVGAVGLLIVNDDRWTACARLFSVLLTVAAVIGQDANIILVIRRRILR